jgi:uncharacterized protein (TIRG00374 family)
VVKTAGLKGKVRVFLVLLLTVFLLVLFLRSSDLRSVGKLVAQTRVEWFIVGLLANFTALLCRTERWRTILRPDDRPAFYPTFVSTALGFMSSAVLPIRAGDIIRPALLSRKTNIRFSSALGTVLTEKILDLSSILILFVVFIYTSGQSLAANPATARKFLVIKTVGYVAMAAVTALVVFLVALYFYGARLRPWFEKTARFVPRRFRESWMRMFDGFVGTLRIVHHPVAFVRVLTLTAIIWSCLTAQFYFVARAVHHPLPFSSGFFVTGMTILGLMLPTPGGVGGFHKACQIALTRFYGFTVDASVVFALVFHVVGTAPVVLTGISLFVKEGFSWRQLIRMTETTAEAEGEEKVAAD